jgi:protocatechuate 3,4-dioxygenase beta subunit
MPHVRGFGWRDLSWVAALAMLPVAQVPAPPPPPPPPPPIFAPRAPAPGSSLRVLAAGSASLSGIVTTGESPAQPVRHATVRLAGVDDSGSGQSAITDDAGVFTFTGLPAGRYTLTASRPAFVSASYGAKRPEGAGSAISVADGEHVTGASLRLPKGAVIAGTIRDENGEPLADQSVYVMRYRFNRLGERTLQQASRSIGGSRTDDRGAYRIWGLAPGDYLVVVTSGIGPRGSAVSHQVTADEVRWARQAIQNHGQAAAAVEPPAAGPDVTYAPVFYPGTAIQADAGRITVGEGEERLGADVTMRRVPVASIHGTVTSADGAVPPNLQIALLAHERIEGIPFSGFFSAPALDHGTFTFEGVMPGTYTIAVRPRPGPAPGQRGPAPALTPADLARFGLADVTMTGVDQTVTVALEAGVTVSGHVRFDGTAPPPARGAELRISLPAVVTGGGTAIGVPSAAVEADGAFTFTGVAPGRYRVEAPRLGVWELQSAVWNGRDLLDDPLDVGSADVGDVTVTFSDQPAELTGTIQDAAGHPAPEYFIIAFAADERYWTPESRRIQETRPANDGRFRFGNLAPGEYLVAAVTDVEPWEWFDPTFLNSLRPAGIPITIGTGEKKVQNFRLAR